MNITKDLLKHLNFISLDIKNNNLNTICYPVLQKENKWTVKLSNKIDLVVNECVYFQFNFVETIAIGKAKILETEQDYLIISIPEPVENKERILLFYSALNALEYNDERFGRRKEQRIIIGIKKSDQFGLETPEQTMRFLKIQQPCAIVDASVHGIQIITPFNNPFLRNLDNFYIKIHFINPDEVIVLNVHKVHVRLNRTKSEKIFANISCQILEPINFIWKERIIKQIERENNNELINIK